MRRRRQHSSGIAIIEFTLSLTFLIPLLLGTLVFGFRLIRSLEMQQIVRDLGHMYVRGVDFRLSGPAANAQTLATGYDLSATGTSVIVFSQIKVVSQADCDAANPTFPAGTHCTNLNKPVFTEQYTVGNSSLTINGTAARSGFGTPPTQTDHSVTTVNQANNGTAVANGFGSVIALQTGEYAYLVEMFNATAELNIPGLSGSPQVYARSVF